MTEEIRKLEQSMNDYIVNTNACNSAVYNNLELFYELSSIVEAGLCNHIDILKEEIYYSKLSKMTLFDKLKIITRFYKDHNIEFDLNKHLNDGTIDYIYHDCFNVNQELENSENQYFINGSNYYENSKKLVDIGNHGLVTDILVSIHELSHLRNQPDIRRSEINDLLTEALAYAEELICVDYLAELGYQEDMRLWKKRLYYTFYCVSKEAKAKYKVFSLFNNLGSLSESSYELFYGNKDLYEKYIGYIHQFTRKNNFNIYYHSWYVMGAVLGNYLYTEYKNDPSFMNNINLLHDKINDSDMLECLKLMKLTDLNNNDLEKLSNSLQTTVNELKENNNKKLVKKDK
ncbi:MAG: hypothetical protein PHD10_04905 [Bacilli bacterium]|nr:hypothetical protein [Bacilli bacterium]MDD4608449.1 hypothetical protein [Bacilli bacterium]